MLTVRILYPSLILILIAGTLLPVCVHAAQKALVLGIFPRHNAMETMHDFQPLADYLSRELKRRVKLETSANFSRFWQAVKNARYDIVHYNQYHYLRSHERPGYDVIAMNQEFGHNTIAGGIVVLARSRYRNLDQLRHKKIIFGGGPRAMMSYIVPRYLLKKAGFHRQDYYATFAKNPPNALHAVCLGQAVAAGVGDRIVEEFTREGKCKNKRKLRFIALSQQMAQLPWAVRANLPAALRDRIRSLLINLHDTRKGKNIIRQMLLTNIVSARDADYNQYRKIVTQVNEDDN